MHEDKSRQAFKILQFVFVIAPIVAGLDKFFYLLTNWSQYIAPYVLSMFKGHDRVFMSIVGVIEIIAGIGMIMKPQFWAYIVSLWLLGIVVNLLMTGHYYDIALRDFGLMLSAFACARLSHQFAK